MSASSADQDERRVRRVIEEAIRLVGDKAAGWWVLNGILLSTKKEGNSDADILVGIPNVGILIIEMKGWISFEVNEDGVWLENVGAKKRDRKDPYKQSLGQCNKLFELLCELRNERILTPGQLPKIGNRVLFYNLVSTAESRIQLPVRDTLYGDQVLPSEGMTREFAGNLIKRLRAALVACADPERIVNNSQKRLWEVHEILNPAGVVDQAVRDFVDREHRLLDERSHVGMEAKAEDYAGNRLYVEGAAGTGKTYLALHLAINRSRASGRPGLYLCVSELLAQEVRKFDWILGEDVLVMTPEELLIYLGRPDRLEQMRKVDNDARIAAVREAQLLGLRTHSKTTRAYLDRREFGEAIFEGWADASPQFSSIVVDEAQDLPSHLLETLEAAVDAEDLFALFADPRQSTRRERTLQPWSLPRFVQTSDKLTLTTNYRNGRRIVQVVEEHCGVNYRHVRYETRAEVKYVSYEAGSNIEALVINEYQRLADEGLSVAVLVSGVNAQTIGELELSPIAEIRRVDEFKGLERKCIILVLGPETNPLEPNNEDVYVGLTRASTHLTVIADRSWIDG